MHPPRFLVLVLVLVTIICILVAGCTPAAVSTPVPTPTVPQCTPEFGGEPYPCTRAEHDQMVARQAQYAEAERVLREYTRLNTQEVVERREVPSPELLDLLAGAVRDSFERVRAEALASSTFEGRIDVVWMRPEAPPVDARGPLAMLVCTDYANWSVVSNDGTPSPSGKYVDLVEFDLAGTHPRIARVSVAEGETCE